MSLETAGQWASVTSAVIALVRLVLAVIGIYMQRQERRMWPDDDVEPSVYVPARSKWVPGPAHLPFRTGALPRLEHREAKEYSNIRRSRHRYRYPGTEGGFYQPRDERGRWSPRSKRQQLKFVGTIGLVLSLLAMIPLSYL